MDRVNNYRLDILITERSPLPPLIKTSNCTFHFTPALGQVDYCHYCGWVAYNVCMGYGKDQILNQGYIFFCHILDNLP